MKLKRSTNLIMVIFAIGILILGCKFGPFGGSSTGGSGGSISESTDPQTAIQNAYKKFLDQKFYHGTTKTQAASTTVQSDVDFVAPDKYLIKSGVANMQTEMIVIGHDSWTKVNGSKWVKNPGNTPTVADMRGKLTDEFYKAMTDFKADGKENLNGKDAFVYEYKSSLGGQSTNKIWVAADSGLPLQVNTEGTFGTMNSKVSIVYDYSKEVKIDPPM